MQSIFMLSIFVGSCLLFLVQPMLAKALLPIVGGAPAVWIVSMLFFQLLLLAGYGYAAIGSLLLRPRSQLWVHTGLFALAIALSIPLTLTTPTELDARQPEPWLLITLLATVGLPYFLLSSNATLIQRWYHSRFGRSPYFLFSVSNAGSFIGLLGYPFLLEWLLPLGEQMQFWSAGFGLLLLGLLLMGITLLRSEYMGTPSSQSLGKGLPMGEAGFIVLLGFIPSSLFLSTTLYITTDIASFPLLWVIPLGLYLLSFIMAFATSTGKIIAKSQELHLLAAVLLVCVILFHGKNTLWLLVQTLVLFAAFFVVALSCHGRAAACKPDASRLTAYFFWLSLGGALGGLFNTLAPYVFDSIIEHYLVGMLSLFAIPRSQLRFREMRLPYSSLALSSKAMTNITLLIVVICTGYMQYTAHFEASTMLQKRSFFGVSTVWENNKDNKIVYKHGTTMHGFQPTAEADKLNVTSYYYPVKALLQTLPSRFYDAPFAVTGLGAGVIACYGREGQEMVFYEIDHLVIEIASDPSLFTYLRDCPPTIRTVLGDGRLKLAEEPDAQFNLLVMDAFTSDAVPMHLLTLEAMQMYQTKVKPETGLIAYNISNRFLDLEPLLARQAHELGWQAYIRCYQEREDDPYDVSSHWLIMAPKESPWQQQLLESGFNPSELVEGAPIWRDDYSNILSVLK